MSFPHNLEAVTRRPNWQGPRLRGNRATASALSWRHSCAPPNRALRRGRHAHPPREGAIEDCHPAQLKKKRSNELKKKRRLLQLMVDAEEGGGRLLEAFIVSAATELGDRMTPVMMFCFAPEDAHLMQYKPVPGRRPLLPRPAPPSSAPPSSHGHGPGQGGALDGRACECLRGCSSLGSEKAGSGCVAARKLTASSTRRLLVPRPATAQARWPAFAKGRGQGRPSGSQG